MVRPDLLSKFSSDGVQKHWRIVSSNGMVIENDILIEDSVRLEESLCSSEQLEFGTCESACFEFQIYERVASLKGTTITVYLTLDNEPEMQIGVYKVDSDKPTADRKRRDIVAYDALHEVLEANVMEWYNSILPNFQVSLTLQNFRYLFLTHFGLSYDPTQTLLSDSLTIKRTVDGSELSGKQVIESICQLNACFGHIDRTGRFIFVELPDMMVDLFPRVDLYPSTELFPSSSGDITKIAKGRYLTAEYEDYKTASIDKVVIVENDEDLETATTYGEGTNAFVISENFLLYDATAEERDVIAERIYNAVKNIYYTPCTIESMGNLCIEVGDRIRVSTTYDIIYTYVLSRSFSGTGHVTDRYEARGNEKRNEQVNSISDQLTKLNGRYSHIVKTIDRVSVELGQEITDLEGNVEQEFSSMAQQTAQALSLKVSKRDIVNDLNSAMTSVTVRANGIDFQSTGSFTVNTTNFTLDSVGNVGFKGAIRTGSSIVGAAIDGGVITSSSGTYSTEIQGGVITSNRIVLKYGGSDATSSYINPNMIQFYSNNHMTAITDREAILCGRFGTNNGFSIDGKGGSTVAAIDGSEVLTAANFNSLVTAVPYATQAGEADTADSATYATQAGEAGTANFVKSTDVYAYLTSYGNIDLDGPDNAASVTYVQDNFERKSSSDHRLKCDIKPICDEDIELIENLRVYNYKFKDTTEDDARHYGVMAQSILSKMEDLGIDISSQGIVEEYVTRPYKDEGMYAKKTAYRVRYQELFTILLGAWQRDHERIAKLEDKLNGGA